MRRLVALTIAMFTLAASSNAPAAPPETAARQLSDFESRWHAHYQTLHSRRLVDVAQHALSSVLDQRYEHVEVTPVGGLRDVTVAKGKVGLVPRLPTASLLRPRVAVTVTVSVDGKPAVAVPVWFRVKVIAPVLVYNRNLPRGTLLGADDLRVAERDLTRIATDVATEVAELPGKWLTRAVRAGDAVLESEVAPEPLVKRDERVKVLLTTKTIAITASGIASKSGYRGDMIKVLIDGAQSPSLTRVLKKGVVEVVY